MAISPKILEKKFQEEISSLEEKIDSRLREKNLDHSSGGGRITMDTSLIQGLRYTHFDSLRSKYIGAGWLDVKWHSDQRDGDYLEFIAWT
jgi:hypothetical protein